MSMFFKTHAHLSTYVGFSIFSNGVLSASLKHDSDFCLLAIHDVDCGCNFSQSLAPLKMSSNRTRRSLLWSQTLFFYTLLKESVEQTAEEFVSNNRKRCRKMARYSGAKAPHKISELGFMLVYTWSRTSTCTENSIYGTYMCCRHSFFGTLSPYLSSAIHLWAYALSSNILPPKHHTTFFFYFRERKWSKRKNLQLYCEFVINFGVTLPHL